MISKDFSDLIIYYLRIHYNLFMKRWINLFHKSQSETPHYHPTLITENVCVNHIYV